MNSQEHTNFSTYLKARLLPFSPHSVLFPFYHAISDQDCPHLKNLYRVQGAKRFEKDIDELLKFMTPLSMENAIHNFREKSFGHPSFHLSFDDGLREAREVIAPILLRKGIPATFFITSGFTNNKTLFHRHKVSLIVEKIKTSNSDTALTKIGSILNTPKIDRISLQKTVLAVNFQTQNILDEIAEVLNIDFDEFLKKKQPYLNDYEIKQLEDGGFSIGLHSLNHAEFYRLNETGMEHQITESQRLLNELTGIESKLFSFPFTDFGVPDSFIKKIIEEYKMITFGTAGIKHEPIEGHFQRIPMDSRSADSAIGLIASEILRYRVKVFLGRQKARR